MKTKELIFVPTGEVRPPNKGESFMKSDEVYIGTATFDFDTPYPIYKAEEIITEWMPKSREAYYIPAISGCGEASYVMRVITNIDEFVDTTFVFPTPELATAQAQKWIDEAKSKLDSKQ